MGKKIVVVGSVNPQKKFQQYVQVLGRGGCSPTICARDYKDPAKVLRNYGKEVQDDRSVGHNRI